MDGSEEELMRLARRLVIAVERIADAVDRVKESNEEEQWKPTDYRDSDG